MHVCEIDGEERSALKTEAMHFPVKKKSKQAMMSELPDELNIDRKYYVPFIRKFKYLGCIITQDLSDQTEIRARNRKSKEQLCQPSNHLSKLSRYLKQKSDVHPECAQHGLVWM